MHIAILVPVARAVVQIRVQGGNGNWLERGRGMGLLGQAAAGWEKLSERILEFLNVGPYCSEHEIAMQ